MEEEAAAVEAIAKVKQAAEESSTVAAKIRAKRAVTKADLNNHLPLALQTASGRNSKRNPSSNPRKNTIKQPMTLTAMITLHEDLT